MSNSSNDEYLATLKSKSKDEILKYVEDLQVQFKKAQQRSRQLEGQLTGLRSAHIEQQKQTELAEEFITNKLMKKVEELQQEKSQILQDVEREEEYLTNNIQKRLANVEQEKVDLENQLETEEEYIVNKLRLQLEELQEEKSRLETKLVADSVTSIKIRTLKYEIEDFQRKKIREIQKLSSENFGLKQQLLKANQHLEELMTHSVELESGAEITDEREFNESKATSGGKPRSSSISKRPPKSLTKRRVSTSSSTSQYSGKEKYIKQEWMIVQKKEKSSQTQQDQQEDEPQEQQYIALCADGFLRGYATENVNEALDDNIMFSLNMDLVVKLAHTDTNFSLTLKDGNSYEFLTPNGSAWIKIIGELLPQKNNS